MAFFYVKFMLFIFAAAHEEIFYRTFRFVLAATPQPLIGGHILLNGFFGVLWSRRLHMDESYAFQIIQQIKGFLVNYFYGNIHVYNIT